ncbi:hypothetical protein ROZALSC1DRAFT_30215 [Rozella allomycis CSF55]|uniref:Uncharacterized protein n=1 Tax=Rozella allomycis (strain CSF55) TaxID=988480 RepID=A0A4P9YEW1_ROZAC|nr:hypothetical protein ROZALSC1DRAFT_30215 [Rozella allomycis CSF55]
MLKEKRLTNNSVDLLPSKSFEDLAMKGLALCYLQRADEASLMLNRLITESNRISLLEIKKAAVPVETFLSMTQSEVTDKNCMIPFATFIHDKTRSCSIAKYILTSNLNAFAPQRALNIVNACMKSSKDTQWYFLKTELLQLTNDESLVRTFYKDVFLPGIKAIDNKKMLLNFIVASFKLAAFHIHKFNIFQTASKELQELWITEGFEHYAGEYVNGLYNLLIGNADIARSYFFKIRETNLVTRFGNQILAYEAYVKSLISDQSLRFNDIFYNLINGQYSESFLNKGFDYLAKAIPSKYNFEDVVDGMVKIISEAMLYKTENITKALLDVFGSYLESNFYENVKTEVEKRVCQNGPQPFFTESCFTELPSIHSIAQVPQVYFFSKVFGPIYSVPLFEKEMNVKAVHDFHAINKKTAKMLDNAIVHLLLKSRNLAKIFDTQYFSTKELNEKWAQQLKHLSFVTDPIFATESRYFYERVLTDAGRNLLCNDIRSLNQFSSIYMSALYFCDKKSFITYYEENIKTSKGEIKDLLRYLYFLTMKFQNKIVTFPELGIFSFAFTKYRNIDEYADSGKSGLIYSYLACIEATTAATIYSDKETLEKWLKVFIQHGNEYITLNIMQVADYLIPKLLSRTKAFPEMNNLVLESIVSFSFYSPFEDEKKFKNVHFNSGFDVAGTLSKLRNDLLSPSFLVRNMLENDNDINWPLMSEAFRYYQSFLLMETDLYLKKYVESHKNGWKAQRSCIINIFQVGKLEKAEFNILYPEQYKKEIFELMILNKYDMNRMEEFNFLRPLIFDKRREMITDQTSNTKNFFGGYETVHVSGFGYSQPKRKILISKVKRTSIKAATKSIDRLRQSIGLKNEPAEECRIGNIYVLKNLKEIDYLNQNFIDYMFMNKDSSYCRGHYEKLQSRNGLFKMKYRDDFIQPMRIVFGRVGLDIYIIKMDRRQNDKAYRNLAKLDITEGFVNVFDIIIE